jgi:exosortase A-associated hydrolase 2
VCGSVLYVPPFAEEMHKARRMAAVQARRLAARGFGVLVLDPTGCGDSSGDFGDARWELWLDDCHLGLEWLHHQAPAPALVWGLRLGALLALEVAQHHRDRVRAVIMWQPITSGAQYLTELLRIKVGGEIIAGRAASVTQLRQALSAAEPVEIGGYCIAPELAEALEARSISTPTVRGLAAAWLELVPEIASSIAPASQRAINALTNAGMNVTAETVPGEPFWQWDAQDITECPELLARTDKAVDVVLTRV